MSEQESFFTRWSRVIKSMSLRDRTLCHSCGNVTLTFNEQCEVCGDRKAAPPQSAERPGP